MRTLVHNGLYVFIHVVMLMLANNSGIGTVRLFAFDTLMRVLILSSLVGKTLLHGVLVVVLI